MVRCLVIFDCPKYEWYDDADPLYGCPFIVKEEFSKAYELKIDLESEDSRMLGELLKRYVQ